MKHLLVLGLFALLLSSCSTSDSGKAPKTDSTKTAAVAPENLQTAEMTISGMTCEGCENTVCTSLKENTAVTDATASFTEGKATVSFDKSKTSPEMLKKLVEAKGYTVDQIALK